MFHWQTAAHGFGWTSWENNNTGVCVLAISLIRWDLRSCVTWFLADVCGNVWRTGVEVIVRQQRRQRMHPLLDHRHFVGLQETHTHTHNKKLLSWSASVSDVEYICWRNQWEGAIWSIRLWWSRPAAQELVCFHVCVYKWPSITHVKSSLLMLTACCLTRCVMAVAWLEVAAFLGQTSDCCAFHTSVFSSVHMCERLPDCVSYRILSS